MIGHVPPHRWADALAGALSAAERDAAERHAARCERCQRARERVERATGSFGALRAQTAPELPWDAVRARVHWEVSTARRSRSHAIPGARGRARLWGALAVAAAAGAVVYVAVPAERAEPHLATAAITPPAPSALEPALVTPAPLAGLVTRTQGVLAASEVLLDGAQAEDLFARRLGAGSVLATRDARVDVQFGEASAFTLGPRSTVELRRFDDHDVELVVDGTIDLDVGPRAPEQRFVVIAGEHAIEVRGTQFQVRREGDTTEVACRHGLIVVRDRTHAQVEIGAGRRVRLAADGAVTTAELAVLSVDELEALAEATPVRMPVWAPDALATGSAPLEIAAATQRQVRIDGVELGPAPLRVRVLPGRHTVEAADRLGRFRRAGWVDVSAPGAAPRVARLELTTEPPRTAAIAQRRRQLRAGIEQAQLARCTRSITKAGLTDTFVQIELAVDETGAVEFLNVIDTDLPSITARCVRDVLADVRFGPGAAATWRERVDL